MRYLGKFIFVFVVTLALLVGTGFLSKAKAEDGFDSDLVAAKTALLTPCVSSTLSTVTFSSGDVGISGEKVGKVDFELKKVTDTSVSLIINYSVNGVPASPATFGPFTVNSKGKVRGYASLGLTSGDVVEITCIAVNDSTGNTFAVPGVTIGKGEGD